MKYSYHSLINGNDGTIYFNNRTYKNPISQFTIQPASEDSIKYGSQPAIYRINLSNLDRQFSTLKTSKEICEKWACCVDGECTDMTENKCASVSGVFYEGIKCEEFTCPVPSPSPMSGLSIKVY